MFVYSFRASTVKLFAVMALAVASLVCLALFVPAYGETQEVAGAVYDGIRTEGDRVSLLTGLGLSVKGDAPIEVVSFRLPEEMDLSLAGYNELQREQGFDLSRYKKKTLTRYTYEIENYEGYAGTVYANLLLFRDRVVAADICSADPAGFVRPLFPSALS